MTRQSIYQPILEAALAGLQIQRQRIEQQIAEVRRTVGARPQAIATHDAPPAPTEKRKVSAAARKRMAAAQRRRWAAHRKQQAK